MEKVNLSVSTTRSEDFEQACKESDIPFEKLEYNSNQVNRYSVEVISMADLFYLGQRYMLIHFDK